MPRGGGSGTAVVLSAAVAPPSSDDSDRDLPLSEALAPSRLLAQTKGLARGSGAAAGLVAVVALVRACASGAPPEKSREGLTRALGAAAHVVVGPDEFVWEEDEGVIGDFEGGRRVLFLGAERVGAPRDLYRARVRLSPEGRPLEIVDVVDLTSTPLGDEQGLVRDPTANFAAFASYAYGQLQGLTVLDLRGEARATTAPSLLERGMNWITNVQETGDGKGLARIQILLEKDATAAVLAFEPDRPVLDVQLAQAQGGMKLVRVDVDRAELVTPVDGVTVELLPRVPKKFIHWAVDTVRAIPWIGPEPIAWLEEKVWALKDKWRRFWHEVESNGGATEQAKSEAEQQKIIAQAVDPSAAGEDGGYWPPRKVPTIFEEPEPGEGEWVQVDKPWMHHIEGAPFPFYRTFVRPDPERPYSKIILVAMDTRQLDFDMEAGVDDPKPTVGSFHGMGRIPRDEDIAKHAVAAFNGGFKTEHGHYGMMLKKHILLPPVPNAATAVVMDDGRFGLGSWSPTRDLPPEIESYRQNMDPLVEGGIFNPRHRSSWGAVLPGQKNMSGQQTERSGLCLTKARHVLYVWGNDVGPDALGKGMQLAGCDYGIHLDMNPMHTGFVFMSFEDAAFKNGKSETLSADMAISNRRYIDYNPKDFFYVMLRDPEPRFVGSAQWQPDAGVQPQPTWIPAIWQATRGDVVLTSFEPGRVRFVLRAGTDDEIADATIPREITGEDAKHAIASIGLGASDKRYGMIVEGKTAIPTTTAEGSLFVRNDGSAGITLAGEALPPGVIDLVQGETIVADGRAQDAPSPNGTFDRIAVGVTKEGRIVVAQVKASSDDGLAKALLDVGCVRAISARGDVSQSVARAGVGTVMTSYAQTTLYALAHPMGPRAFRFDQSPDGAPRWPPATAPVP